MFWLKLHRWMGLCLLIFMFLFGFTGSVLVWPDGFNSLIHPDRYPASATTSFAPTEAFLDKARAGLAAGDRISGLRVSPGEGAILVAGDVSGPAPLHLGPPNRTQLWMDPASAAILDRQDGNLSFIWAMHAIHGHMLLRNWGREVVAILGLCLMIMSGIGLWLWWPGAKAAIKALKWRKPFSKSMNLHRQTGAVLGVVMIVEAMTGAWIALPRLFEGMIDADGSAGRIATEGPPSAKPMADPAMPIDRVIAIARQTTGSSAPLVTIFFPSETNAPWRVGFEDASVSIDDKTAVATVEPPAVRSRTGRITDTMEAIHAGHLGPIWQIIVFLSGVILCLLSVTGLLIWWQGRARLRKRRIAV